MKPVFLLCAMLLCHTFTQGQNNPAENILFVVDSIPLIQDTDPELGELLPHDIATTQVITRKDSIRAIYPPGGIDKVVFINTVHYINRPDSLKHVPNLARMVQKSDGLWYDGEHAASPYTGPFVRYYNNGRPFRTGTLKKGAFDSALVAYYIDGSLRSLQYIKDGEKDGPNIFYFPNGKVHEQGLMVRGKMEGEWQERASSGELRRSFMYRNNKPEVSKEERKKWEHFIRGQELAEEGDLAQAIRVFSKAIERNPGYPSLYYHRATAYLNSMEFEKALTDYDKAIDLEPFYQQAYAFRALALIRQHELGSSRKLTQAPGIAVLAGKQLPLPEEIRAKACADLQKARSLGNGYRPVLEAIEKYCK